MTHPETPYTASLGPTRIYLDDLERVNDILTAAGWKPEFIADGRNFGSVSDLSRLRTVTKLEVQGRHPEQGSVRLILDPHYASLSATAASPEARSVCEQIKSQIEQRHLPAASITFGWLFPLIAGMFVVALVMGGYRSPVIVIGLLLSVPLGIWAWATAFRGHTVILLKPSAEYSSGWSAEWQRIAPFVATAMIGVLIGYVGRAMEMRDGITVDRKSSPVGAKTSR